MPLIKSHTDEARSKNIEELIRSGRDPKQAAAIAYAHQRKYKKMNEGGQVAQNDDEPSAWDTIKSGLNGSGDVHVDQSKNRPTPALDKGKAKAMSNYFTRSEGGMIPDEGELEEQTQDEHRGLGELQEDSNEPFEGEHDKMVAEALAKMNEGGIVEEDTDEILPPHENLSTEPGEASDELSEEQKKAILAKKQKRKFE